MLYLAYGSNLSRTRMARRCPAARPLWPVTLPGWVLRFERVATIASDAEGRLAAAVYHLSPACARALDQVEGVAEGRYRRATLTVPRPVPEGDGAQVLTYIKVDDRRGPPAPDYVQHILDGFADWGLDLALLRAALADAEASPRHRRNTLCDF